METTQNYIGEMVRETEKAYCLNMLVQERSRGDEYGHCFWMPKSAIAEIKNGCIQFNDWGERMIWAKFRNEIYNADLITEEDEAKMVAAINEKHL